MEQMDRYHFRSMWSRPTICSFQLQGMSKTSCHVRPDKRSSLPYRITWRPAAATLQRPAISQEWPTVALRKHVSTRFVQERGLKEASNSRTCEIGAHHSTLARNPRKQQ